MKKGNIEGILWEWMIIGGIVDLGHYIYTGSNLSTHFTKNITYSLAEAAIDTLAIGIGSYLYIKNRKSEI